MIGCAPNLGALFTPHCAAIHPGASSRAASRASVERLGVTIYERTPVDAIEPGRVRTPHGDVRADVVVRATEAFSRDLPGLRRALAPVYSLMIATEPLPDAFWADAGLATRPTFTDFRHMIIYGQRTADGRFAFGGRGTPYHFGSRIRPAFERDRSVFRVAARDAALAVPGARRRRDHASVGRRGRGAARLVSVGRLRPRDRHRVGAAGTSATA